PVDGFVKLAIYNLLGEKVADLVNTKVNEGTYEVTFDAAHFSSGVYLYRMESGDFVSVKKMMILK
ncbi:MAG: T9SS type A sorting domain-containing protein, partial [Ignavibacteriaceae bacterium]